MHPLHLRLADRETTIRLGGRLLAVHVESRTSHQQPLQMDLPKRKRSLRKAVAALFARRAS